MKLFIFSKTLYKWKEPPEYLEEKSEANLRNYPLLSISVFVGLLLIFGVVGVLAGFIKGFENVYLLEGGIGCAIMSGLIGFGGTYLYCIIDRLVPSTHYLKSAGIETYQTKGGFHFNHVVRYTLFQDPNFPGPYWFLGCLQTDGSFWQACFPDRQTADDVMAILKEHLPYTAYLPEEEFQAMLQEKPG